MWFQGHTESVTSVIQLDDGNLLSTSMDGTLRKWSQEDGACMGILMRNASNKGHTEGVYCVMQLEDGRLVSGSGDKTMCIWDSTSLQCVEIVWGHTSTVTCLTTMKDVPGVAGPFTTPGDLMASGSADLSIR